MQNEYDPEQFVLSLDYLEGLQEEFSSRQLSFDPAWNSFFRDLESFSSETLTSAKKSTFSASEKIEKLIQAYRRFGHQSAVINPLNDSILPDSALMFCKDSGIDVSDSGEKFSLPGFFNKSEGTLDDLIKELKNIYCMTIGFEFDHIDDVRLKSWIQQQIESGFFSKPLEKTEKFKILNDLTKAEFLESFLHTKHVGKKRFSLEGAESLIPMLTSFIEKAAFEGVEEILIGMAHRGRLNVLANVLNKSIQDIFQDFNEEYEPLPEEKMGDIRYHKGHFNESFLTKQGKKIRLFLSPNPSHLESVDPVIEGQTKAKQVSNGELSSQERILPILLHGDAAIAGQGIVYETLQMGKLNGYQTGGTLHFVINNQIGFTTFPKQGRSTLYCTDIAKSFGCPVFHVNGEDPEACVKVTLFALEIRQRFHCDVFIDLNCYRKYGHNEGDEPGFTQPSDYKTIRQKQSIRQLYRNDLIESKIITEKDAEAVEESIKSDYQNVFIAMQKEEKIKKVTDQESSLAVALDTGVKISRLKDIAEKFSIIPPDFHLHPKVKQLVTDRKNTVLEGKEVDWGLSEFLAYGTLVTEGIPVRISGQDCGRGTFSHRHALWVDQENGKEYFPLAHIDEKQGRFEVFNSHLSEMGVLGFEYGYSTVLINGLTIWEAQFGDFFNSAQVIIDQYIASGEQKWNQMSSLVLFLPHGFEGQGPEHSSARLERFLTLAGHDNMQIVNPTTPAQLFHLLRRQVLQKLKKPLIVFTPKGLLRHPLCLSPLEEFEKGSFLTLIDDPNHKKNPRRLVFCSGRIFYDLETVRKKENILDIALVRIEQLYPLDTLRLKEIIQSYGSFKECIWVQEEPKNMGAWNYISSQLQELLPANIRLVYVGREQSATPATGFLTKHKKEHAQIMQQVFNYED